MDTQESVRGGSYRDRRVIGGGKEGDRRVRVRSRRDGTIWTR